MFFCGGWTALTVINSIKLDSVSIEHYCNNLGLQLFVPRTKNHLKKSIITHGIDYFILMGIYPRISGLTCAGNNFKYLGCINWSPKDNGKWYVQDYKDISEPNGDNVNNGSMVYSFNIDGTINGYNDAISYGTTNKWLCSAKDEILK